MRVLLDIGRLVSRLGREAPTGIDRVELAYARHFTRRHQAEGVIRSAGRFVSLGHSLTAEIAETLDARWSGDAPRQGAPGLPLRIALRRLLAAARPAELPRQAVYLNVAHHRLGRHAAYEKLKRSGSVSLVFLVHDLIPIRFPEYARPGHAAIHGRRMAGVVRFADHVIVNSDATGAEFRAFAAAQGRKPPLTTAWLGLARPFLAAPDRGPLPTDPPYFVSIGTIEPRKNHLLLMTLWRRLAERHGSATPKLHLVGRRGWENEQVLDFLDRSPITAKHVIEHPSLGDGALADLIRGARAVLMPSFVEGFGLPVAEALALGVPVIASDIPALREIGQGIPDHLDPTDGPGWLAAVEDYKSDSARRWAQLERLKTFRPPTWERHFEIVEALLGRIA